MINWIKAQNFGRHETFEASFTEGVNIIRGANEGGKSTVLEMICVLFFGAGAIRGSWEDLATFGASGPTKVEGDYNGYLIKRSKQSASVEGHGVRISGHKDVTDFFLDMFGIQKGTEKYVMIADQGSMTGILASNGHAGPTSFIEKLAGFDQIDEIISRAKELYPASPRKLLEERVEELEGRIEDENKKELPDAESLEKVQKQAEEHLVSLQDAKETVNKSLQQQQEELSLHLQHKDRYEGLQKLVAYQEREIASCNSRIEKLTSKIEMIEEHEIFNIEPDKTFLLNVGMLKDQRRVFENLNRFQTSTFWEGSLEDLQKEFKSTQKSLANSSLIRLETELAVLENTPLESDNLTRLNQQIGEVRREIKEKSAKKSLEPTEELVAMEKGLQKLLTQIAVEESKIMSEDVCSACGSDIKEKKEKINSEVELRCNPLRAAAGRMESDISREKEMIAQEWRDRLAYLNNLERELGEAIDKEILTLKEAQAKKANDLRDKITLENDLIKVDQSTLGTLGEILDRHRSQEKWLRDFEDYPIGVNLGQVPHKLHWCGPEPVVPSNEEIQAAQKRINYNVAARARKEEKEITLIELKRDLESRQDELAKARKELVILKEPVDTAPLEQSIKDQQAAVQNIEEKIKRWQEELSTAGRNLAAAKEILKAHADLVNGLKYDLKAAKDKIKESAKNSRFHRSIEDARRAVIEKVWNYVLTATENCFAGVRGVESRIERAEKNFLVDGMKFVRLSGSTQTGLGLALRGAIRDLFTPNCDFMLADEPFADMDFDRTAAAMAQVAALNVGQVIMCTHEDMSDSLADNLVEV